MDRRKIAAGSAAALGLAALIGWAAFDTADAPEAPRAMAAVAATAPPASAPFSAASGAEAQQARQMQLALQQRPFDPITEDRPLRAPGREPERGVHIKTTQERVFVSGSESVRFTVAAVDDDGRPLPLLVTQAAAFDLPDPRQVAGRPQAAVAFNDSGLGADAAAGDGVHSGLLQPAAQG